MPGDADRMCLESFAEKADLGINYLGKNIGFSRFSSVNRNGRKIIHFVPSAVITQWYQVSRSGRQRMPLNQDGRSLSIHVIRTREP